MELRRLVADWQEHLREQIYLNDFSVRRLHERVRRRLGSRRPACRRAGRLSTAPTRTACRTTSSTSGASRRRPSITCRRRDSRTAPSTQSVVGLNGRIPIWARAYGWTLPWARDGVGVAFGIERRVEKLERQHRRRVRHRRSRGTGRPDARRRRPVHGGRAVRRNPRADHAAATLGVRPQRERRYRYSNYSTDQHTNSYGIGAEWAPVKEGKLRGSYQQAVRAANIIELFTPQGLNLFNGDDPCAGPTPDGDAGADACAPVLPPAQYGPTALSTARRASTTSSQGGNPSAPARDGEDLHARRRAASRCRT